MKRQSMRGRLLASTMICGVMALGVTSAAMAADAGQGQEVVVTGSRIPQLNLKSVSPLAVVSDTELKAEGTVGVETLLNNMPQVFADQGADVSNGSSGTATVNLRGLGTVRTLVLVDSTRLMPGDPAAPVPDLNTIPAALVSRVEILTGGASSVYGADAVAGVVNFIMKHDFEGVRIDAQYGAYNADNNNGTAHGLLSTAPYNAPIPGSVTDGGTWDITAIIGANSPDHKGNITAYMGYRNLQPVTEAARDYSACSIATTHIAGSPGGSANQNGHVCAGSSNSAFGRFVGYATSDLSVDPAGTHSFVGFTNALRFSYAPFNYFQRSDDRYTGGYFAHYEISPMFDVYSNMMFSDDHTVAQIAPSGLFLGPNYSINCNNPLMTHAQQVQLCGATAGTAAQASGNIGFRFAGHNRQDDLRHTSYRVNIGTKGDLGDGWHYDAYAQYGTAILNENYKNDLSISHIQNALLADPANPGKCLVDVANCVPLNIFQAGQITPQQFAYVAAPAFKSGSTSEQIVSASVTGDLGRYGLKSPFAKDGVGVALGTEYRRETLTENVDLENSSGDLSGSGGKTAPAGGSFEVREVFGEVRAPLVQDVEFAKLLSFEGGYRYSQYTPGTQTKTYKAALEWAPTDDVRFRGSYNRAVRSPGISELNGAQNPGLFGGNDPCAGVVAIGAPQYAGCILSGATAAQLAAGSIIDCPAAQCNALFGGNKNLKPETADTYTYGVVFTPTFFKGFNLSVDYFDIKVDNLISAGAGGPAVAVSQCTSATPNPFFCSLFHRNPVNGNIFGPTGYIVSTNVNAGFAHEKGIDVEANYRTTFSDMGLGDLGALAFNLVGTYTKSFVNEPAAGLGTYDCAGLYGNTCGVPNPKWRSKFRVTWATPWPVSLSVDWRYLGSVTYDGNSPNPLLANHPKGRTDTADQKLPSMNYFDLSGTWRVRDKMTVRAGVNNVFDKNPPIVDSNNFPASGPPFGNGNTFPQVYDSLGRFLFVGLTADF